MDQPPTTVRLRSLPIAQLVGIAMLAWAFVPTNLYGYYVLLRVMICAICAYLAFAAFERQQIGWVWVLAITAVVYNPFIRVHLNREIWSAVNIATMILLALTIWTIRPTRKERA